MTVKRKANVTAMEEKKPGYGPGGAVKKIRLEDGLQVGIKNLDAILKEVAGLNLTDTGALKTELLQRVKACNYVASGAEREYAAALLQAYQRKFGSGEGESGNIVSRKKTSSG